MIKYPNGKKPCKTSVNSPAKSKNPRGISNANRGMELEAEVNQSNEYYSSRGIAYILKRPTPINVVKVDYTNGPKIISAYFEKQSTTDYNGIYKGRYIDFEVKSTMSKTSFPFHNIPIQQIQHLKNINSAGGISFFIIQFCAYNEVFLVDSKFVIEAYEKSERKSLTYQTIKEKGHLIKQGLNPRLEYIPVIDELYF